jgi:hypothetical protein
LFQSIEPVEEEHGLEDEKSNRKKGQHAVMNYQCEGEETKNKNRAQSQMEKDLKYHKSGKQHLRRKLMPRSGS